MADDLELPEIRFREIECGNRTELQRLLRAGESLGFFYLNLEGSEGMGLLELQAQILEFSKVYLSQPLSYKMKDCAGLHTDSNICGYKPLATETGVVDKKKDGFEAIKKLLAAFSDVLAVHDEGRFEKMHLDPENSSSSVVVNYYNSAESLPEEASMGHNAHTDLGSIMILFCSNWGLQVWLTGSERWAFVEPRTGCARTGKLEEDADGNRG
ncbi:hypothetical protein B0H67DRAFT_644275 [Lasiosphaeris hirsuta]|uniref:Uncharacterized protein n=1 Tax=Lasiosphaeris hirsuta TaxID=260670 RepID=A0AA40ASC0_9PEZI|nr:hypothetical protein B0H67DRAFT_644275 [Lasiosphaeris hirsuta]